jgi:uncharacterized protein YbbC (DUF1343 family)
MRAHGLWLLWVIGCTGATPADAQVRPGIEVLVSDSVHLVRGKRLGLLTNHTGVDRHGRRDADLLIADSLRLIALFSPEHGFRGLEDRPGLPDAIDSATRIPIYSLYGGSRTAALSALDSVDVLLVDLQDIGARYYTYIATTASLMRDAAARHIAILILDRPDPIGGTLVQGNVRGAPSDPDSDFVGFLPVAMRPGMTLGEMARMANDVLSLQASLTVIRTDGWLRRLTYDSTGLPWIKPSPNMPSLESAFHYPGLCLFEGTNLSVGRGTPIAFQVVGAPWLDGARVLRALREAGGTGRSPLVGVDVIDTAFTPHGPTDGKYDGVQLTGLRFRVTDRTVYDATLVAVALLTALRSVHPDSFQFKADGFDRLAAGPELRLAVLAGRSAPEIWRTWSEPLARFRRVRAKYLLY